MRTVLGASATLVPLHARVSSLMLAFFASKQPLGLSEGPRREHPPAPLTTS
jgi:hypothetical protein